MNNCWIYYNASIRLSYYGLFVKLKLFLFLLVSPVQLTLAVGHQSDNLGINLLVLADILTSSDDDVQ